MKRNLVLVLPLIALLGAGCSSTRNAASTESAPATTV
ncbi:MAG: molybdate-binding protein, partial [Gammaproteobacteria bacterium]|nr:molybdate-binding protein [Gammaproteobacteria bacterium]